MAEQITGGGFTLGGTIILTGSVQNLPDVGIDLITVWIQSYPSNAGAVSIVDTTGGNVIAVITEAGGMFSLDIRNTQAIRVQGTASDKVYWGCVTR